MLHQLLWGTIDYQHGWQINLILFKGTGFWLYIGLILFRAVIWELILRALTRFRWLPFVAKSARALIWVPTAFAAIILLYELMYHFSAQAQEDIKFLQKLFVTETIIIYEVAFSRYVRTATRHFLKFEDGKGGSILLNIVSVVIYAVGTIIILNYWGVSLTPLVTAMGFSSFIVVYALQNTLGNLVSGVFIIVSRVFRVGDYIAVGSGVVGYVDDISWRQTVLRMSNGNRLMIPNSNIVNNNVTNYSWPTKEYQLKLEFSVPYENDLVTTKNIINDVLQRVVNPAITKREVFYTAYADTGILVSVSVEIVDFDIVDVVRDELIIAIQGGLAEAKIIIRGIKKGS
ncbi:MAG: mechanosensitive ion channel family protein [Bacillota bacterium]